MADVTYARDEIDGPPELLSRSTKNWHEATDIDMEVSALTLAAQSIAASLIEITKLVAVWREVLEAIEGENLTTSEDSGIIARSQGQVRPEPDGREQT